MNFIFHILCLYFYWSVGSFLLIHRSSLYIVDLFRRGRFYHYLVVAKHRLQGFFTSSMGVKYPTLWFGRLMNALRRLKRSCINRNKCGWGSLAKPHMWVGITPVVHSRHLPVKALAGPGRPEWLSSQVGLWHPWKRSRGSAGDSSVPQEAPW